MNDRGRIIKTWRNYARGLTGLVTTSEENLEQGFFDRHREWKARVIAEPGLWNLYLTWAAIGLMTFGHVDAIQDAIAYIPKPPPSHEGSRKRHVVPILIDLLPLPDYLTKEQYYVRSNPEELQRWFDANSHKFRWDDDELRFILFSETPDS